jgi:hypothetical protein
VHGGKTEGTEKDEKRNYRRDAESQLEATEATKANATPGDADAWWTGAQQAAPLPGI